MPRFKRSTLFFVLFLSSFIVQAQHNFSVSARKFLREAESRTVNGTVRPGAEFIDAYGLYARDGKWYGSILLKVDQDFNPNTLIAKGAIISSHIGDIVSLRLPLELFPELKNTGGIVYADMNISAEPFLDKALKTTRADSAHMGAGGLNMSYTGKGVIVAVIDWGFNYSHPVFLDSAGTKLRISKAWDQNKLSGPAPAGYTFGTVYEGDSALLAAEQDTFYNIDTRSHGSHVSGIAAGNGAGTVYQGMAPDAEIVMVSLRRDPGSFIDAISFIHNYAASVNKPYVVNMSFGGFNGPNDGSTLENGAMDTLSSKGGIYVASAGNSGAVNMHINHNFSGSTDTLKTVVNNTTNAVNYFGQYVNIWGPEYGNFSVKLRMVDPTNKTVFESSAFSSSSDPDFGDTLLLGGDTLIYYIEGSAINPLNKKPNIAVSFRDKTPYKPVLVITSSPGMVHMWNVARLWGRISNWAGAFSALYPGATAGTPDYSIGGYAGATRSAITVAAYSSDYYDSTHTLKGGALASFSSRGPLVDNRRKPEIAGPGVDVLSAVNINDSNAGAILKTVTYNGRDYPFSAYSGTSMSSPALTGIVALMLQANPKLPAYRAKQILIATARLDQHTGQIPDTGSNYWGWGKANALAAILLTKATVSVPEVGISEEILQIYPNPARDMVNIRNIEGGIKKLSVFDLSGKLLCELFPENNSGPVQLNCAGFIPGMYLIQAETRQQLYIGKLLVTH